jgi:hypothetical protein
MKGVKFAGQKEPDSSHDKKGQQKRKNILFGSRTGWGRLPFGGLKSFGVSICLCIRIQKMSLLSRRWLGEVLYVPQSGVAILSTELSFEPLNFNSVLFFADIRE